MKYLPLPFAINLALNDEMFGGKNHRQLTISFGIIKFYLNNHV